MKIKEGEDRMLYIIRAALAEEANDGWVWMAKPSRTVVRINNLATGGSVYCQARDIRDPNFVNRYNQRPRISIVKPDETVVMGEWYRKALGIVATTHSNNVDRRVDLDLKDLNRWGWGVLRAACHQPDVYVRLASRLGVLGAWLGVFGLMVPLANLLVGRSDANDWLVLAVAVATGIFGIWICRGPRRLR